MNAKRGSVLATYGRLGRVHRMQEVGSHVELVALDVEVDKYLTWQGWVERFLQKKG